MILRETLPNIAGERYPAQAGCHFDLPTAPELTAKEAFSANQVVLGITYISPVADMMETAIGSNDLVFTPTKRRNRAQQEILVLPGLGPMTVGDIARDEVIVESYPPSGFSVFNSMMFPGTGLSYLSSYDFRGVARFGSRAMCLDTNALTNVLSTGSVVPFTNMTNATLIPNEVVTWAIAPTVQMIGAQLPAGNFLEFIRTRMVSTHALPSRAVKAFFIPLRILHDYVAHPDRALTAAQQVVIKEHLKEHVIGYVFGAPVHPGGSGSVFLI